MCTLKIFGENDTETLFQKTQGNFLVFFTLMFIINFNKWNITHWKNLRKGPILFPKPRIRNPKLAFETYLRALSIRLPFSLEPSSNWTDIEKQRQVFSCSGKHNPKLVVKTQLKTLSIKLSFNRKKKSKSLIAMMPQIDKQSQTYFWFWS